MIGSEVPRNEYTPDLWVWIRTHVERRGTAPSAAEIREAANFSQAGGIARLCVGLESAARSLAALKARQEGKSA